MLRPTEELQINTSDQQNGFSITKSPSCIDIPVSDSTATNHVAAGHNEDGSSFSNLVIINESHRNRSYPERSTPTPPIRLPYINGNRRSVTSLSNSFSPDTCSNLNNNDLRIVPPVPAPPPPPPQFSSKEAIRVIVGAIDAQINSVTDMFNYFTKLVKAEKAVQHALSDLAPSSDQVDILSIKSGGFHRLFQNSMRRKLSLTTTQLSNFGAADTELNKIMQNLVSSTSQQARAYSMRAVFHKVVTLAQLESLLTCQQCLKKTYVECENQLQSQVQQYATDIQQYEKKYYKLVQQYSSLRSRLSALCDKRASFARRHVETLMNNLTTVTQKLQIVHNDYSMSLSANNHFQQWLHTQLRPCLLNGIERTMQLSCEVVRHLLVFGGESVQDNPSSWLEELQTDRNLSLLLKRYNVQFSQPTVYEFEPTLAQRLPSLNVHSVHTFVFNDYTNQKIDEIIRLYQNRELVHRDGVHHITMECVQWEEALAQWRAVFANPLPNPWANISLGRSFRSDSSASSVLNSSSNEDAITDGWTGNLVPDFQELWQDDRSRPVNLCLTSYRLTIYEFELRFTACLADVHSQIVSELCNAQAIQSKIGQAAASSTISPSPLGQYFNSSFSNTPNPALPSRLQTPQLSHSATTDSLVFIPDRPSSNLPLVSTSSCNSNRASPTDQTITVAPNRLGGNRLWNSVRHSVNRFRSHFTRSTRLPSSNGSGVLVLHSVTELPPLSTTSSTSSLISQPVYDKADYQVTVEREFASSNKVPVTTTTTNFPTQSSTSTIDQQISKPPTISQSQPISSTSTTLIHTDTTSAKTPEVSSIHQETIKRKADINKEPWFHGVLPRAEVERLLQNQGDYLVRQTNKRTKASDSNSTPTGSEPQDYDGQPDILVHMVLSVYWSGHKHFILGGGDGPQFNQGWHLEDRTFPTIRDLLDYHVTTQIPVTVKSGALLITPINRPDWELDNADVQLVQKIGQGNFGEVYRGYYNGGDVAVKICRADANASHIRQKFLQGERTALNLCHPHIVRVIGIAVRSYPVMIVMEFVAGGSLLTYLRKSKNTLTPHALNLMCSDAASGMAYLELKNCIHRDLAARNCLITESGRVKIADFGMSRQEHVYELTDLLGQIPIKWTAPDALSTGRYTIKCDVWSYGVLLWEIYSFGDIPYRTWSNPQTRKLVESGYRLPAPPNMPTPIRNRMFACWEADPKNRPSFAELSRLLHVPTPSTPRRIHSLRSSFTPRFVSRTNTFNSVETPTFSRVSIDVKDSRTRPG